MSDCLDLIKKIILITFLVCSQTISMYGQESQPPIPVELFFGNEALYSQLVLARDFSPSSKFSLFSLSTFSSSYNEQADHDMVIINQVSYSVGKGVGLIGGLNMNATIGLSPIIGSEYVYASRKFLAVSILSYAVNGSHDLGLFGLYEFKPPISDKLALYTRLQFLYERGLQESQHNRSFIYLRFGLKKNKLNFGFGANLDQYGPQKEFKANYGAFVGWGF